MVSEPQEGDLDAFEESPESDSEREFSEDEEEFTNTG